MSMTRPMNNGSTCATEDGYRFGAIVGKAASVFVGIAGGAILGRLVNGYDQQ